TARLDYHHTGFPAAIGRGIRDTPIRLQDISTRQWCDTGRDEGVAKRLEYVVVHSVLYRRALSTTNCYIAGGIGASRVLDCRFQVWRIGGLLVIEAGPRQRVAGLRGVWLLT